MDFEGLISRGFLLLKSEPIIAGVIVVIIAALFYFKTKAMFKLLALILVLVVLFYFFTLIRGMTMGGVSQKENLLEKTQQ